MSTERLRKVRITIEFEVGGGVFENLKNLVDGVELGSFVKTDPGKRSTAGRKTGPIVDIQENSTIES
jgi:hypothetical protein